MPTVVCEVSWEGHCIDCRGRKFVVYFISLGEIFFIGSSARAWLRLLFSL